MSIIHIQQIKAKLKSMFESAVDISDYDGKSESERDSVFFTRALAAFVISATADIEPDIAGRCVTDGYNDNGLDAIYFDEREKILFLVQTKWHHEGNKSIERGDALKFIAGVKDLINTRFDNFNEKINNRSTEIINSLSITNTRIRLIIVHTGQASLGQHIERDLEDFLREMNDPTEVASYEILNQKKLYDIIASGSLGAPINLDVIMTDWGKMREPFSSYYGRVAATDVASWMNKYYPRIFEKNIRSFLSSTEINQGIVQTLLTEPDYFWYLNNGLTILCDTIKKKPMGGINHDSGVFECTNVSIVNGAQTVGAIATAYAKSATSIENVTVMVRFISLENCPDGFAARITRATNTQNRIETRDFISLDLEQQRLQTELQLENIEYVYKSGYSVSDIKNGFDVTEATVALACSYSELSYTVHAKDKISLFWDDVSKSPYKSLFNSGLSIIKLWRLVQIHRLIENQLKPAGKRSERGKGRESMLPIHANRFLARQVFRHLELEKIDDPRIDIDNILKQVPSMTDYCVKITMDAVNEKYSDSYLANLFRNKEKCQVVEMWIDEHWNKIK